jgi:hypothetical protein
MRRDDGMGNRSDVMFCPRGRWDLPNPQWIKPVLRSAPFRPAMAILKGCFRQS